MAANIPLARGKIRAFATMLADRAEALRAEADKLDEMALGLFDVTEQHMVRGDQGVPRPGAVPEGPQPLFAPAVIRRR